MKYWVLSLWLLAGSLGPAAAAAAQEEKPKPTTAEGSAAPPAAGPETPGPEKIRTSRPRGLPLDPAKKGKSAAGPAKPRAVEPKSEAIVERPPVRPSPGRHMIVTDVRGRKVELTDFHLGSAGFWEYDGLRLHKPEDPPPAKKPRPGPAAGRARTRQLQESLRERLSQKRTNREEPDPRSAPLKGDVVLKWDAIREADLQRNGKDKTLYARVVTTDNRLIKGPLHVASDYLIGSLPGGKDFVIRLRNVKHIAFSATGAPPAKKPAADPAKPRVASVKRGDKEPKRMQTKPSN